jgi:hypothetical protein
LTRATRGVQQIGVVRIVSGDVQEPDSEQTAEVAVPEVPDVPSRIDPLTEFDISIPSDAPVLLAEKKLSIGGSVSFALDVARIDRAEQFYHDLFELDVMCRAWRRDDGSWDTTTEAIDWPRALINGYYPELVVLQRPGWTLVLHGMGRGQVLKAPKIGDAEVPVSPDAMRRLRAKLLIKSYTVVHDSPDQFAFRDPFAMVWTLVRDESLSE